MKKLFPILILQVFIIGGVNGNSFGENNDGNSFLKYCKASPKESENQLNHLKEAFDATTCTYYISGFMAAHDLETIEKSNPLYCPPKGATIGQAIRVFVKYMEDHPERLHELAGILLRDSLAQAFPCPKENK